MMSGNGFTDTGGEWKRHFASMRYLAPHFHDPRFGRTSLASAEREFETNKFNLLWGREQKALISEAHYAL